MCSPCLGARLETLSVDSGMSAGVYLHSDSKLGALVVVSGGDESLAKDIAMHVAAFNPLCLSQDDIDPHIPGLHGICVSDIM